MAWDVNLITMLSLEPGNLRLVLLLALVPCSTMPRKPEASNSLAVFSAISS